MWVALCLLVAAQDLALAPDGFQVEAAVAGANSLTLGSALSTPSAEQLQAIRTKARLLGDSPIDVRLCMHVDGQNLACVQDKQTARPLVN